MIGTLLLAGGAIYASIRAYRDSKKKSWQPRPPALQQRVKEISVAASSPADERQMVVARATLGFSAAGALLFQPLGLVAIPGLLYLAAPRVSEAWLALIRERRLSSALPGTVATVVCITQGLLFVPALGFWFAGIGNRALRASVAASQQRLLQRLGEQPQSAWIAKDGVEVELPFERFLPGDILFVAAGSVVPVDGKVVEGGAWVDQSRLHGEETVTAKGVGDAVFAGSPVISGQIRICVEKAGEQTLVSQLSHLLKRASEVELRSPRRALSADSGVLPLLGLGLATGVVISPLAAAALMSSQLGSEMDRLAPILLTNYLNLAAQDRILFKDGTLLAKLSRVDTVLLPEHFSQEPSIKFIIRKLRSYGVKYIYFLYRNWQGFSHEQFEQFGADGALKAASAGQTRARIAELQAAGKSVCYVDDSNHNHSEADAQVIRQAEVAVSICSLSAALENPAQVLLLEADATRLIRLFELAKEFEASMASLVRTTTNPGIANLASVIFLRGGLVTAMLLNNFALYTGLGVALLPIAEEELNRLQAILEALIRRAQERRAKEADDPQPSRTSPMALLPI